MKPASLYNVAACLLGAGLVLGAPAPFAPNEVDSGTHLIPRQSSYDPCAFLGSLAADQGKVKVYTFLPSAVKACLKTVPFVPRQAATVVSYLKVVFPFQSTLGYLKSPPSEYNWPGVDLIAGLDKIGTKVNSNGYTNHIDFEIDIYNLVASAHDGHFNIQFPLLSAFSQKRLSLVSVSSDGNELPKVYLRSDVNSTAVGKPAITNINGQSPEDYLLTVFWGNQDKDAAFNAAFFNPSTYSTIANGAFANFGTTLFEDFTNFTFSDGSSKSVRNAVLTLLDLSQLTTGADLYNALVAGSPSQSQKAKRRLIHPEAVDLELEGAVPPLTSTLPFTTPLATATSTVPLVGPTSTPSDLAQFGYPTPQSISDDKTVAGYFLNDQPDTAVLVISKFVNQETGGTGLDFQSTVRQFLASCKTNNKKKLIIDVRGNPGGLTATAYDTFKQLFPNAVLETHLRLRYHSLMDALGSVISNIPVITLADAEALNSKSTLTKAQNRYVLADVSVLNAANNLKTPNGDPYSSWSEFRGPITEGGDKFSNYYAFNFDNLAMSLLTGDGVVVAGHGNNTNVPAQVFQSSDITLLTDGSCASSCGILSNLLIREGNVSTIVIGGLPEKRPMAIIGGTQGAQVEELDRIIGYGQAAALLVDSYGIAATNDQVDAIGALLSPPLIEGGITLSFNWLDNLAPNSDVPLQFSPHNANCRAFYTAGDINDVSSTWSRIASENITCIDGGKPNVPSSSNNKTSAASSITSSTKLIMSLAVAAVLTFSL